MNSFDLNHRNINYSMSSTDLLSQNNNKMRKCEQKSKSNENNKKCDSVAVNL